MKGTALEETPPRGQGAGDRAPGPGQAGCERQPEAKARPARGQGSERRPQGWEGQQVLGLRAPSPGVRQTPVGSSPYSATQSWAMGQVRTSGASVASTETEAAHSAASWGPGGWMRTRAHCVFPPHHHRGAALASPWEPPFNTL